MTELWKTIRQALELKLTLGNTELRLMSAIELILILVVFFVLSRYFRKILQSEYCQDSSSPVVPNLPCSGLFTIYS